MITVGSINLNSCLSVVSLNEPIKHYKFVFDVCTTERVYHLAADTEEERSEWVSTLKELLYSSQSVRPKTRARLIHYDAVYAFLIFIIGKWIKFTSAEVSRHGCCALYSVVLPIFLSIVY